MTMKKILSRYKVIAILWWLCVPLTAWALPDFTEIVKENSPPVVKIITTYSNNNRSPERYLFGERDLPEAFRDFFTPRRYRQQQASGSGFIISQDGYIVTNYHIVENADKITVRLFDQMEYVAQMIGTDQTSDLALLKIKADKDLPHLQLGEPDALEVGEWVIAIGSPFGLDYSVAAGIVSAKGRSLPNEQNQNYVPFIQTDVAINPGNSGGPLFNLKGELVGVNSQIYTRSGGSIGLSFAIPVEVVRDVIGQLRSHGSVRRGWLGVGIQAVSNDLAESFGLSKAQGALVTEVFDQSPADLAGLRSGDIILYFNGKKIEHSGQLPHFVGATKPGARVGLLVVRDKKKKRFTTTIANLDERTTQNGTQQNRPDEETGVGLVVENIPDDRSGARHGVIVHRVISNSVADRSGFIVGDIIVEIGGQKIQHRKDFDRSVVRIKNPSKIPVKIIRNQSTLYLSLVVE